MHITPFNLQNTPNPSRSSATGKQHALHLAVSRPTRQIDQRPAKSPWGSAGGRRPPAGLISSNAVSEEVAAIGQFHQSPRTRPGEPMLAALPPGFTSFRNDPPRASLERFPRPVPGAFVGAKGISRQLSRGWLAHASPKAVSGQCQDGRPTGRNPNPALPTSASRGFTDEPAFRRNGRR